MNGKTISNFADIVNSFRQEFSYELSQFTRYNASYNNETETLRFSGVIGQFFTSCTFKVKQEGYRYTFTEIVDNVEEQDYSIRAADSEVR